MILLKNRPCRRTSALALHEFLPTMFFMGHPRITQAGELDLPASLALHLVEFVKRWGVMPEDLLSEFGLQEEELEEPNRRVPCSVMSALIERSRAFTGELGLGFYLGLDMRASMYGYLGFAAMSASTLGEALQLAIQYTPIITSMVEMRLRVESNLASLIFETRPCLESAEDVALFSLLTGLWQMSQTLTGKTLNGHADFALPEPAYFSRFAHLVPTTRFDQPITQIVFDVAYLEYPLVAPDRAALRLAKEQCERELQALGFDRTIVARVRRVLPRDSGFRKLAEVALLLHLSLRTLKRRLADQGTSFSTVLDQERCQRALILLRSKQLTLEEISERLGYSTLPNFTRAFRRWTGNTPAAYRRKMG